ncbi:hypothetical protein [Halobacterium sp. BOL4-2]|uniref:hypothetical protein n=1 Tax=Halobacterium sp. BOL4-2 TaxID=2810537 RepID=UPI00196273A5|nr:hypothetical protein [Halobacterium sp. BOL4-2]QRY26386.1 hypothetical protein JRZ79_13125 [Halobacterium sp. BOL4-2]
MSNAAGRPTATTGDRNTYPELREDIGEDPARYLTDLNGTTWARIRGIQSDRVIQAWLQVEEDLGPRRAVIKRLNKRRRQLRDGGEGDA